MITMASLENRNKINIRLDENVYHWPTLKTVLMVEKTLKEHNNAVNMYQKQRRVLAGGAKAG